MEHTRQLELRVLDGEQQGARCRITPGEATILSGDWSDDIVLRGVDLASRRLEITTTDDGVRLQVHSGDARVGDRVLQAGESVELPWYTPVHLGGTVVALGEADGLWQGPSADESPLAESEEGAEARAPAGHAAGGRLHRWSHRLIAGGGAVAAVSAAMLAFAYTAAPTAPTPVEVARQAEASLHAAGFPRLVAQVMPNGEIAVNGYLETNEQRTRVERLLEGQRIPARLSVWVNEQVAGSVIDVYRVNGVVAQAEVTGPGAVRVNTRETDVARLEQIKAIARRDVPGLSVIEVRNAPPPAVADNTPVVDDPGKRVASIVPGDPSYVVTADGTRYFEGALLPTGHRIASIADHEVMLEKAGATTPLKF